MCEDVVCEVDTVCGIGIGTVPMGTGTVDVFLTFLANRNSGLTLWISIADGIGGSCTLVATGCRGGSHIWRETVLGTDGIASCTIVL